MAETAREAWVAMQKKTFTRWANQYLAKRNLEIEDISHDLKDGIKLLNLLEVISDEQVGRYNKNPKMEIQMYENLNLCIKFLKDHDIPLVNIGSQDIYKSNEKLILGLLWTIILRFEVSDEGKQGLLLWVQRSTKGYDGVDVQNFSGSWKDGLPFCALINRYRPDLLTYDGLSAGNAADNCEMAFSVAEKELGITRLLDTEDVANNPVPDDKSIIAYVSQFFKMFAGAAKNESLIKAIKNAIEVTKRHDNWMESYETNSQEVQNWATSKAQELEQGDSGATTNDVKTQLDDFSKYLKEVKPAQQAARNEMDSIYTTLSASKRNNNRPEFAPAVTPATLAEAWTKLQNAEQEYERSLLEKYLRFQRVDHAVSKFNSKASALEAGLDEKDAVFEAGVQGTSIPEVESQLEVHNAYQGRLAQYKQVLAKLEELAASAAELGEGHAGIADVSSRLEAVRSKLQGVEEKGNAHSEALQAALEQEKVLMEMYQKFMHGIDDIDFDLDQLEEQVHDLNITVSVAEIETNQASIPEVQASVATTSAKLDELRDFAEKLVSKIADAPSHVATAAGRLDDLNTNLTNTQASLAEQLESEASKDKLKHQFADEADGFHKFCEEKSAELAAVSGSLEEQQAAIEGVKEGSKPGADALEALSEVANSCEEAGIIANQYTSHTINSLKATYAQLGNAVKLADDSITEQIASQKAFEIPPEALRELKQVYAFFDTTNSNALNLQQLREACQGVGLALDDDEVEAKMKARRPEMEFSLEDFTALYLEELQTGDSKEDVVSAFKSLAGSEIITSDQLKTLFQSEPTVAEYCEGKIVDGNYIQFTEDLFTR